MYDKRDDFNFETVNFPFLMLRNSTTEKKLLLFSKSLNKVINTINFVKLFLNFITDKSVFYDDLV